MLAGAKVQRLRLQLLSITILALPSFQRVNGYIAVMKKHARRQRREGGRGGAGALQSEEAADPIDAGVTS